MDALSANGGWRRALPGILALALAVACSGVHAQSNPPVGDVRTETNASPSLLVTNVFVSTNIPKYPISPFTNLVGETNMLKIPIFTNGMTGTNLSTFFTTNIFATASNNVSSFTNIFMTNTSPIIPPAPPAPKPWWKHFWEWLTG